VPRERRDWTDPNGTGPEGPAARPRRPPPATLVEHVVVDEIELVLERPRDPESLVDEAAFADDEFLPYWAERWPSGLALAHHLAAHGPAPRDRPGTAARVLELGCGLAIPSLVAAGRGAEVVATDWSADAVSLLERNAGRNALAVRAVRADWREADLVAALGPFDLVVAADVLYEERNVAPILALLDRIGTPAIIADPGRRHAPPFLDRARRRGWEIETTHDPRIPSGGIHRLRRVRPS
jgi:predicted nicotinamide N-methyase